MKPTIHLNGTAPEALQSALTAACSQLDAALKALDDAAPNGRDYYPQGSDAIHRAGREHAERCDRVRAVRDEVESLLLYVQEEIDVRAERRRAR